MILIHLIICIEIRNKTNANLTNFKNQVQRIHFQPILKSYRMRRDRFMMMIVVVYNNNQQQQWWWGVAVLCWLTLPTEWKGNTLLRPQTNGNNVFYFRFLFRLFLFLYVVGLNIFYPLYGFHSFIYTFLHKIYISFPWLMGFRGFLIIYMFRFDGGFIL